MGDKNPELDHIKRLRSLRNYLTELNNAGISLGETGYYEYQYFELYITKHEIYNPFINKSITFQENLCRFLNSMNGLDMNTKNAIDLLCDTIAT